ncbi:MAG: LemA family protein, partial [Pseudomonadota bacterium]
MVDIFGWFWTSAVFVIVFGSLFGIIVIYNTLVRLRQNVRQGRADIDAQLRQRHDLIPNLVETVKGYAGHESTTLENVIKARNVAAKGAPDSGSEQGLRVAL